MRRGLGFLIGDDDIPMLSGMEAVILELLAPLRHYSMTMHGRDVLRLRFA